MAKVKELMWAVREPPVFQLARAELPDLTSYPVRVLYDDGKEEIKNLRYADKLGLKPYQRGMQTAKFTFGGATLTFSVNYSEDKLTHIELLNVGKTEYNDGDVIDDEGFQAKAFYARGDERTVPLQCSKRVRTGMTSVPMRYGCCKTSVVIKVNGASESRSKVGESKEEDLIFGKREVDPPKVIAISICQAPMKRRYLLGKVIPDLRGGVLDAIFDDGSVRQVPMNSEMVAKANSLDVGETQMRVHAFGFEAVYDICILEPRAVQVAVKQLPQKTDYQDRDTLDLSGLVLSVLYNDDSIDEVKNLNVRYELRKGEETVRLNYMGIPFEIPVVVRPREHEAYPISLIIAELPDKTTYYCGEKNFDPSGGQLLLQMSDGIRKPVPLSDAQIRGFDTSVPCELNLTAIVQECSCCFSISVQERKIVKITVEGKPRQTYFVGEKYSFAGLVVYAQYNTGEKEAVTEYETDKTTAALGDTCVAFLYHGHKAQIPVFVKEKRLVAIKMLKAPNKRKYICGESIVCDGGKFKITYEDGQADLVVLESEFLSTSSFEKPGVHTVDVSYKGLQTGFDVEYVPPETIGIEIISLPITKNQEGDLFDSSSLELAELFSNGERRVLQSNEYELLTNRPLLVTDTVIVASYQKFVAAIPIHVESKPSEKETEYKNSELIAEGTGLFTPFYPSMVQLRFPREGNRE